MRGRGRTRNSGLQGQLNWIKDNILKSSLVVWLPVGSLLTIWFQHIYIPSLMPLNVITEVSTRNPSVKRTYAAQSGTFSPLELAVTVQNPGIAKLHLLRTVWVAEICSITDFKNESDKGSVATPQSKQEADMEPTFETFVESNNKVYTTSVSQIYRGYKRECEFIGTGRLLHDTTISPKETLRTNIVVVYPVELTYRDPNRPMDSLKRPVDFIRITTFIPSMTKEDDAIRSALIFPPRAGGIMQAPEGMGSFAKEKGAFIEDNSCVTENKNTQTSKNDQSFEPEVTMKPPEGAEDGPILKEYVNTTQSQQVWCQLPLTSPQENFVQAWLSKHWRNLRHKINPRESDSHEKIDSQVNYTRSVSEAWLRDRVPK